MISGKGATVSISQQPNGLVLDSYMVTHAISPDLTRPTLPKPLDRLGKNHSPSTSTSCTKQSHQQGRYRDVTEKNTTRMDHKGVGPIPNIVTPSSYYDVDPAQGVIMRSFQITSAGKFPEQVLDQKTLVKNCSKLYPKAQQVTKFILLASTPGKHIWLHQQGRAQQNSVPSKEPTWYTIKNLRKNQSDESLKITRG